MSDIYTPPCTITPAIVSLVADISHVLGRLTVSAEAVSGVRLRRINRIRTLRGTLAIEGNMLGEEQITALLDGKRVMAPPREIQEARNAIKVYDQFGKWSSCSRDDLLEAHRVMMEGLLEKPGAFRAGGVGVMGGGAIVHLAPPAERVPLLMDALLEWLKTTDHHPLVVSSVFHYEFEFIHPFEDGNGRMGRLWQTMILSEWNPLFSYVPVESLVYKHQMEYYDALGRSTKNAESSVFIEFMLRMILEALGDVYTPEVDPEVTPEVKKLLSVLKGEMTRRELQSKLRLKDEKNFRENYLLPAIARGLVEMTRPEKPRSRLQKYRIASPSSLT